MVSSRLPGRLVLGADQTLALGERSFHKPVDRAQAVAQLRALSGRRHELHSAIALVRNGQTLFADVSVARMTMRQLDDAQIDGYLNEAGEAATASVGAYQLEGLGVHLFDRHPRRSFHHSGPAAGAAVGISAGAAAVGVLRNSERKRECGCWD